MQRTFIVREDGSGQKALHDFLGDSGIVISVTRQGIAAGVNAAGGSYSLPNGFLQTRTSQLFGQEIAAVGLTSSCYNNMSIISGKYKGLSRPDYYPDGRAITIKVSGSVNPKENIIIPASI